MSIMATNYTLITISLIQIPILHSIGGENYEKSWSFPTIVIVTSGFGSLRVLRSKVGKKVRDV